MKIRPDFACSSMALGQIAFDRHLASIDRQIVIEARHHVEDPLRAELEESDFEIRITVQHAAADDG
ncbi:MAG TPA: hypothetical protein VFL19_02215, partial [Nitrospira sp.]|nr:hypothetical protein [Nitrospira sp.]